MMLSPKIYASIKDALPKTNRWKDLGYEVVFTNGCFDVLHPGHLKVLIEAASKGDKLIVGLNGDASVSKLKGPTRPIHPVESRAMMLAAMEMVDMVIIFNEETPAVLLDQLIPDVLVKGGDYKMNEIVGTDVVKKYGGKVEIIPFLKGHSTSEIINELNKEHQ